METQGTDGLEMTQDVENDGSQQNVNKDATDEKKVPATTSNPKHKSGCKRHGKTHEKTKAALKSKHSKTTSGTDSTSISDNSGAEDTAITTRSESESEKDEVKSGRKAKVRSKKSKSKKRRAKTEEDDSSSDSILSSDSDLDSDSEQLKSRKLKSKKKKKKSKSSVGDTELSSEDDEDENGSPEAMIRQLQAQINRLKLDRKNEKTRSSSKIQKQLLSQLKMSRKGKKKMKKVAAASKVAYKRLDQLWDQTLHDYKLTETVDRQETDKFDQYIFTVRRKFDWEHKYQETLVDIRSKPLKEAISHILDGVKSIALHVAVPKLDPNLLFLYLEEMRTYMNELKALGKSEKKTKATKAAAIKAKHLKVMVNYLDTDYADTKKTLYPMLENGTISFDLLWALYKPNTIAYTPTYGDNDEPRAFKIDFATKEAHFSKGIWYCIEGKYLEYSGKAFGMAPTHCDVESFKGARSITSLSCYPLKYHKDSDTLRNNLIERGKQFVTLKGVNYKHHKGIAYTKKKRQILRICINGRVMIDSAIFRRINPNYPIGDVRPKDADDEIFYSDGEQDDESCDCGASDSDDEINNDHDELDGTPQPRRAFRLVQDEKGQNRVVEIEVDEDGEEITQNEKLEDTVKDTSAEGCKDEFTEEELLIASPVVLGFSFHEKLWLEFSVSGIGEVHWNEGAFESLVLPRNQKSIVRALVSSHKFHPSKNVDDIIANKGLGCCMVLHGPPGTGKTLTAEGIAELLKAPLYMVSAGELGTDARTLERELQNILDIAHSWGAILLLDEADVFMEKRSLHDIHRNSLGKPLLCF